MKAKVDWMVFRTMEKVHFSELMPYVVVVIRSWRSAQERLLEERYS